MKTVKLKFAIQSLIQTYMYYILLGDPRKVTSQ